MWIVRLALRRPYTFVVAAMLVAIFGFLIVSGLDKTLTMPTDIFPNVDIPVVSVAFNYTGMSPTDMDGRIVTQFERILTTTVNDIEHIESQSLYGIGVIKIYFQPNAKIENATAQVTAVAQTATRIMPPGTQPPLILQYNASSVPILQLSLSSDTIPEQQLFDIAVNQLRTQLITIPGVQVPYPYGGKQRQVVVDLEPDRMYALGVSPADVSTAVNNQNLILPAGTAKIGKQEYEIILNSSPLTVPELNDLPIKTVNGATVYVKDVAHVRDGFIVQTNVVHGDGKRGVLVSVLKSGNASTLQVVDAIKAALPTIETTLPKELKITPMFDQSLFVRASVEGVEKEALIAAGLTALMILLFLGSWRSTLIVMISIPLSIMVSIIVLYFLGHTLNVMTLGGMALAVGILVDDATVEIENIHRNLHQRKRLVQAILHGASQIAVPAFVSTLCICIVFVPVVFISGAAKYLFTPLAMAVVFAMLTSYLLSRTLVPTMVHYLLSAEVEMYGGVIDRNDPHQVHAQHAKEAREHGQPCPEADLEFPDKCKRWLCGSTGWAIGALLIAAIAAVLVWQREWTTAHWVGLTQTVMAIAAVVLLLWLIATFNLLWRVHHAFNRQFEKLRRYYGGLLAWALDNRGWVVTAFILLVVFSLPLYLIVGTDFFPSVDAGQIRLHVRCPPGTRIEETERYYAKVEDSIRKIMRPQDVSVILDNMGIPNSSINLSLSDGSLMSPADGEVLISLNENHLPTEQYMRSLRNELPKQFPDLTFFFAPADIVTQVLNFGLQAPVDIQITSKVLKDVETNDKIANEILRDVANLPGVVDVRMQQVPRTPDIRVDVDRTLASIVGVQQKDVAGDLLISLSSNNQAAPNFWLDKAANVERSVYVQTPQYRLDTMNELQNTPVAPTATPASPADMQLLENLAVVHRDVSPTNVTHSDTFPTRDVLMNVQGTDLGTAKDEIQRVVDKYQKDLPRGSFIRLRGQVQSMTESFVAMSGGLVFAVILVYLLMVINFQSWIDPLIILMALPGALAGILWMLFATGTTVSVPALMGAIMSIGVATANSILMITFANDQRLEGMSARDAALAAGLTRLRPVMMTAAAMIIGMLPMSLGLGEGGEQNAPLGRAVIGGLSMATVATLFFVPVVYSLLRKKPPITLVEEELR
jgi:multidrug efflux pump subunit AcrB